MERLKTVWIGLFGSSAAFGSVGVSVEARIEIWLRIGVLLCGLFTALGSLYWMWRINRVRVLSENEKLCEPCREGHMPSNCPVPEDERPADCPLGFNVRKSLSLWQRIAQWFR